MKGGLFWACKPKICQTMKDEFVVAHGSAPTRIRTLWRAIVPNLLIAILAKEYSTHAIVPAHAHQWSESSRYRLFVMAR